MSNFSAFQTAVQQQFTFMQSYPLFKVALDRDEVVQRYLEAFPSGTNEIYRERLEHDCSCCKQFLRSAAGIVAITPQGIETIWHTKVDDPRYQAVTDALHEYVLSQPITDAFLHYENHIGTHHNFEALDTGQQRWDHFYIDLPPAYVIAKDQIDTKLGFIRTNHEMYTRVVKEITLDAVNTTLDLIDQNAIYRGTEFKEVVLQFKGALKNHYAVTHQNNIAWLIAKSLTSICRFKNSVIGTLVSDLSDGIPLEDAVKMYESKVAPTNYKRTTALITTKMIENAQKKVEELGIADALYRRYATTDDLTINNVLFADRSTKKHMGVFEGLNGSLKAHKTDKLDKVQEIPINDFIKNVLPNIESMEIMFEGRHKPNLMSVIAPIDTNAPPIQKWGNNFSWCYSGAVTDSIKERVKAAGGDVSGELRFSLSWFNTDDLDIHCKSSDEHISFSNKLGRHTRGQLDVDMNAGHGRHSNTPVENITWSKISQLKKNRYQIFVNQYAQRNTTDFGFIVEMELMGERQQYHYNNIQKTGENITVCEFDYDPVNGVTIIDSLASDTVSETVWGVPTQQYHKVNMLMTSPNHWDNNSTGNKHWFFILDKCVNQESTRGFFNEFLRPELTEHRKVFEVLSSKTIVPDSDTQLSGLGFSSTKPNHVICKLKGNFNRTIKLVF